MAEDYEIVARLSARQGDVSGLTAIEGRLTAIEKRASSFGEILSRGLAFVGGAAGVGGALRWVATLNADIDETRRGLAGLFTAFTKTPIDQSFAHAGFLMRGLQEDARRGVGDLQDYSNAFQSIYGATGGRASEGAVRGLARNTLAAGFLGVGGVKGPEGMRLAIRDINQALNAGINGIETPAALSAIQSAGISQKKFNAEKDAAKRLEMLQEGFKNFEPAIELLNKSWSVQFSTLGDHLKGITRAATGPIFDSWRNRLIEVNDWLEKNHERVLTIAEDAGTKLLGVWDELISKAGIYAGIVGASMFAPRIATAGVAAKGAFDAGLARMVSQYLAISGPGGIAGGGSGGAPGHGGIPAGATWDAGVGRWRSGGRFVGGAAGALAPAAAAEGGIFATMSAWAAAATPFAIAAALIVTAAGSVYAAFQEWPSLLTSLGGAAAFAGDGLSELWRAFTGLFGEGSPLSFIGAGLIWGAVAALTAFGVVIKGLALFVEVLSVGFRGLGLELLALLPERFGGISNDEYNQRKSALGQQGARNFADIMGWLPESERPTEGEDPGLYPVGSQINNFNGPISFNMKTEPNAEPARVLVAWDEAMSALNGARRQPRRPARPSGF